MFHTSPACQARKLNPDDAKKQHAGPQPVMNDNKLFFTSQHSRVTASTFEPTNGRGGVAAIADAQLCVLTLQY
jgi:hypothetical protein